MIIGKKNITDYFDQIRYPYYAIFQRGKVESGNSIFRNDKGEKEHDVSSGREHFERSLSVLDAGEYTIIISEKPNVTTRGSNRVDFRISVNEAVPVSANVPVASIGSVSIEDVDRRATEIAEKKFAELMLKKKADDLETELAETKKELREAEKRVTDPWNKFIGALAPHSEHIISGLFPAVRQPLPVSGIRPDETGTDQDSQTVIENFITALSEAKPDDWKQILNKLTDLIQNNPSKLDLALNLL